MMISTSNSNSLRNQNHHADSECSEGWAPASTHSWLLRLPIPHLLNLVNPTKPSIFVPPLYPVRTPPLTDTTPTPSPGDCYIELDHETTAEPQSGYPTYCIVYAESHRYFNIHHVYSPFRNYLTVAHLMESHPSCIEFQKSVHEIKHDAIVDTLSTNGKIRQRVGQTQGTIMFALRN
jgi:hypothetical protein